MSTVISADTAAQQLVPLILCSKKVWGGEAGGIWPAFCRNTFGRIHISMYTFDTRLL